MLVRATLVALAVLAAACSSPRPAAPVPPAQEATVDFPRLVPGEILVRWKSGVTPERAASAHGLAGATLLRRFRIVPRLERVRVPEAGFEATLAAYRRNPDVLYAEPNFVTRLQATFPDDPELFWLWGLHNDGQTGGTPDADINAPEAWDLTTGSAAVVIGVTDSGIDYTHPDLMPNLWTNALEENGSAGIDDDGNGWIDDLYGVDPLNGDADPFDDNSHGTHVAGTIAARGDDATGVVGVAWNAQIASCKAFDAAGFGDVASELACLEYFLDLKTSGAANVVATNASWGNLDEFSQSLDDAIGAHAAAEILFVAAAGNEAFDNDALAVHPQRSAHANVIVVAASTAGDVLAGFSNHGRRSVHVAAPGSSILSTVPLGMGAYGYKSGTSMAAPHVTGVIALLAAQDPARSAWELRNLVLAGAQPRPGFAANTVTGARLRAFDAANGGSLNCTTNTLRRRVRPLPASVSVAPGTPVEIVALDLVCEAPATATVSVTVNGAAGALTLLDDGVAPDDVAGDGRFAGTYTAGCGPNLLAFPWGETMVVSGVAPPSYAAAAAEPYSPRTIASPSVLPMGDESSPFVPLPFHVRFGGRGWDHFFIASNGFVTFTDKFLWAPVNHALPSSIHEVIAAGYWDDLDPSAGGTVSWGIAGTEPNREVVVAFDAVPYAGSTDTVSFQMVFSESSDDVLFFYDDVSGGGASAGGGSATIGVQSAPGVASQLGFDTVSVASATGWRFSMPSASAPATAPVVSGVTLPPGPSDEGDVATVSASFTDSDGDGPWTVSWDFDGDGIGDAVTEVAAAGAVMQGVPFVQEGPRTVRVSVYDQACTAGSAAAETYVQNVAPIADPFTVVEAIEGNYFQITSSFSDPGTDDAPWTLFLDLDEDGFWDSGRYVVPGPIYEWVFATEAGSWTITGWVADEVVNPAAGFWRSESPRDTFDVVVADASPIVDVFAATPISGDGSEPTTYAFDLSARSGAQVDPTLDPISFYEWDLDGDGVFETATPTSDVFLSRSFADSGTHTVRVRVHDEDGWTEEALMVSVANTDPVAAAISDATATEGLLFTVQASATDAAGALDPITWSLQSGPAGMQVSPTGSVAWTPAYAQSGRGAGIAHPVTLACDDGDGGTCTVSFTLHAVVRDGDGDGMADTWESANGTDAEVADAAGDADGDGVTNLDEYHAATGGPYAPGPIDAVSPLAGAHSFGDDVGLTVTAATDQDSAALDYVFQIATTEAFDTILAQDSSATTAIALAPAGLTDDVTYWWRAWARDESGRNGPRTAPEAFFYDPVLDPPTVPAIAAPLPGSTVSSTSPLLITGGSTDPDSDAVTYEITVYADEAMLVEVAGSGPQSGTSWTVSQALAENTRYWWSVTASDGANDAVNDTGDFFVDSSNEEPGTPALVAPAEGEIVAALEATLEVDNTSDPEGAPLTYLFELDTAPTFATPSYRASQAIPAGSGSTTYAVADLEEDTTYWWRARAFDGNAYGDFVLGTFRTNATNTAPGAPVALSPVDDVIVPDAMPVLRSANAADADGDALTYVFTILDEDGEEVFASAPVAEGAGGTTETAVPEGALEAGGLYTWSVAATDAGGATGSSSAGASFSVFRKSGGGGGGGGGCSVTARADGTSVAALAALSLAIAVFRRRPRRDRGARIRRHLR